jgi:hypothetical protein
MFHNRFHNDGAMLGPARTGAQVPSSVGFIMVPGSMAGPAGKAATTIYDLAYEQARAALRPSRYDHLLASTSIGN